MRRLTAEEVELGNKEWVNFGQYYAAFGDDQSLYEGLDVEDDNDRPTAGAGITSLSVCSESLLIILRGSVDLVMMSTCYCRRSQR